MEEAGQKDSFAPNSGMEFVKLNGACRLVYISRSAELFIIHSMLQIK